MTDFLLKNLQNVRKPGRYLGNEWNVVVKDHNSVEVKFLLAVPELYEVGMSNLGIKILYGVLNEIDGVLCERVFAPAVDMEELMIREDVPLFSLETKMPAKEFDVIGFSLFYEMTYTNLLNMLHLARIPIRRDERQETDPLVIAGGISCCNPEPIADFIDAFVIGEGEEVLAEVMEAVKNHKGKRDDVLNALSRIEGIYVPNLHLCGVGKVRRRVVGDLENSYYPVKPLVPYIEVIHDRLALEIMRGCPHSCSFCQANSCYSPLRIRSPKRLTELAMETYKNTGYDEISLLSLSSGDYPGIEELFLRLQEYFNPLGVKIVLPSLRIEGKTMNLISHIGRQDGKKGGLTFVPEAGSERLRKVINKRISEEVFLEKLLGLYAGGYRRMKLYYMIGLPTEKEEDLDGIIEFAAKVSELKRKVDKRAAEVRVSIASFIPKPHTPFERLGMEEPGSLKEKRSYLFSKAKQFRNLKLVFHNTELSFIEGAISRGDRRIGEVIYRAWKKGAKFDGWKEHFNSGLWLEAFKDVGIDPADYATRERSASEALPWGYVRM